MIVDFAAYPLFMVTRPEKKNCQLNHPEPPKTNKTYHQSILVVLYELYPHEMVTSPICLIVRIMLKNKSAGVLNGIEMVKNVAMYPNKIIMPWNPCFWWLKISFSSLVELQQSSVAPSPALRKGLAPRALFAVTLRALAARDSPRTDERFGTR